MLAFALSNSKVAVNVRHSPKEGRIIKDERNRVTKPGQKVWVFGWEALLSSINVGVMVSKQSHNVDNQERKQDIKTENWQRRGEDFK
jgi:hypothetical protein